MIAHFQFASSEALEAALDNQAMVEVRANVARKADPSTTSSRCGSGTRRDISSRHRVGALARRPADGGVARIGHAAHARTAIAAPIRATTTSRWSAPRSSSLTVRARTTSCSVRRRPQNFRTSIARHCCGELALDVDVPFLRHVEHDLDHAAAAAVGGTAEALENPRTMSVWQGQFQGHLRHPPQRDCAPISFRPEIKRLVPIFRATRPVAPRPSLGSHSTSWTLRSANPFRATFFQTLRLFLLRSHRTNRISRMGRP